MASDGSVISSGITRLDDAGRLQELSRMLAGLENSEYGLAHAGELLAAAGAERAAGPGRDGVASAGPQRGAGEAAAQRAAAGRARQR
jgi:hypothetical protein